MAGLKGSTRVVYISVVGDFLVAATKFFAALFTGSSSLVAEGIHSVVDASNGLLLLYGYRQSRRGPDERHPLGHGRELYFWSFVVSLLVFVVGSGLSVLEGLLRVASQRELESPLVIYGVLAASAVFDGDAWKSALNAFRLAKGEEGYWQAIKTSKDPPLFMVLVENTAALIGLAIAALGTFAATTSGASAFDGFASILIGIVLGFVAWVLAKETKGLLIGEGAAGEIGAFLLSVSEQERGVDGANGVVAVQLAPEQIVAALSLEFADELRTPDIERAVLSIEEQVRVKHPEVVALYVKPQSRRTFERSRSGAEQRDFAFDMSTTSEGR